MSLSRTFRGYFNRAKIQQRDRRSILLIDLGPEETRALEEQLGPKPHRSQNIAITFVVGDVGDAVLCIRDEVAGDREAASRAVVAQPPQDGPRSERPEPSLLEQPTVLEEILQVLQSIAGDVAATRHHNASIDDALGSFARPVGEQDLRAVFELRDKTMVARLGPLVRDLMARGSL